MTYDCLIIDDEKMLADSTAEYFNLFGVKTAIAYSASDCRDFFRENSAELLLLDINLGDGSGFELCKELRETTEIPILFISARTSDNDKIIALSIGGDDYIQKPYSLSVLLAKVKAVLKRYGSKEAATYTDGHLFVDFHAKQVRIDGTPVKLTSLEFKLLAYLIPLSETQTNLNILLPFGATVTASWEGMNEKPYFFRRRICPLFH